jgi:Cu/Ag efflux pump CusA
MLNWLVSHSLKFRGVVIALAALVICYGAFVASRTKLDVFPEFAPPMVVVQTEAPGLSPEQVEALVTRPLETELNGTPQLASIRSESIQGLSAITLTFDDRADIYRVRQMAGERLNEAAVQLPVGVKAPKMGPLTSSTSMALTFDYFREALADGTPHVRRLDAAPAPARRARRGQGGRLRWRSETTAN